MTETPMTEKALEDDAPVWSLVTFNEDGLVPAIAQRLDTGEVLMMAWMNREALAETLATGKACYWSRGRGRLWRKGESSGQSQTVKSLRVDCDGDTILMLVEQKGVACHTGRSNCFFNEVGASGDIKVIAEPLVDPEDLYGTRSKH
ncbi:MAG: phosphoribosyl-AMP cyclohydrolase [Rhodospirillum sp.]|nr:phosphoribosyl-AMP cyclohydrolase [Rhodospirillum sp.]MCF8487795.1 phosphoribosyl-AMP cyclohydrolase [Rhodospirillum sp.]MCF8499893.1 phosphoribosyl-AMP cyclohydrolase [Rhodospirillum sp.]